MTQLAFPATTNPPVPVPRVGIFRGMRERLFGAHLDEIKVEDHTKFIGAIGRGIAPVLLICFSLAFSIQLAGPAVVRVWQAIFSGGAFNAVDLVNSVTTNLSVVAMDVSMLIAFIYVRDALVREEPPRKWLGFAIFGAIVGLVEAATYLSMLISSEPPSGDTYQVILKWTLDVARSLLAPGSAVFLVVVPQRVLNRKEVIFHILRKTASAMINLLDKMTINGQAEFAPLMKFFLHLSADEGADVNAYMLKVDEMLKELSPNAVRQHFEGLIAGLKGQIADMQREAQERGAQAQAQLLQANTHTAELTLQAEQRAADLVRQAEEKMMREINAAWNEANDMLVKALLFVSNRGELPNSLKDQFPELADLTFGGPQAQRAARPVRQAAPGSSDDLREVALAAGAKIVDSYSPRDAKEVPVMKDGQPVMRNGKAVTKRDTKRAYGVWIRSSDVQLFAGEKLDADELRQIMIAAGDGAKDGAAYVAPLKAILKELARRKKIDSAFVRFVSSGESAEDLGNQSGEHSANIVSQRANEYAEV